MPINSFLCACCYASNKCKLKAENMMLDVLQNGNQMTLEKRRNFKTRSFMKRKRLILLEENINRVYQMIFEESNGNQLTIKITFRYLNMNMNEACLVIIDEMVNLKKHF
jgi:hypothetical protein